MVDSFIPINKSPRRKRGFAFVRFGTRIEAERALASVNGRSWGNKKIQVMYADSGMESPTLPADPGLVRGKSLGIDSSWKSLHPKGSYAVVVAKSSGISGKVWSLHDGDTLGMRVATWVMESLTMWSGWISVF